MNVMEEYCRVMTQACCGRSTSSASDFGFQSDSLVCRCTVDRMHTQFQF